jgi:hypothetical protein
MSFSPEFINKTTKRINVFKTAKKNGLFETPTNFSFPEGIGLDLLNQRAVSKRNLLMKLKKGMVTPEQVYYPGSIILPATKQIVKNTQKNQETVKIQQHKLKMRTVLAELNTNNVNSLRNDEIQVTETMKNFKNVAVEWKLRTDREFKDIIFYKDAMKRYVTEKLINYLKKNGAYKIIFKLGAYFVKGKDNAQLSKEQLANNNVALVRHVFSSGGAYESSKKNENIDTATPVLTDYDVLSKYKSLFDEIMKRIDEYEQNGSGWVFHSVEFMTIRIVKYNPLHGASYIEIPDWLKAKKCCINVKNEDDKCFEYAVLSAIHADKIKEPNRVSNYKTYVNTLKFEGIAFPVPASSATYESFEKQNNIPINVFTMDANTETQPDNYELIYINKLPGNQDPINLLLVHNEEKSHYLWIKNLNGFIRKSSNCHVLCCSKCLQRFADKDALENHKKKNKCEEYKAEATKELPVDGKHICSFNNTKKQMIVPFVLYADCESMLLPSTVKKGENTEVYQTHKVSNIGVKLVSKYPELLQDSYQQFDGDDCMDKFLEYCLETHEKAYELIKRNVPMALTAVEEREFRDAKNCKLCEKELGADRVRDHDHLTGKYRGACHSKCNINFNYRNFKLPVIFHNLRGYDSHLILQHAGKLNKEISCIPNTMEKYLSFSVGQCVFLDSLQFTLSSLEALVNNLNKAGDPSVFANFNEEFACADAELKTLLRQKGVFPYDWFNSVDKLQATSLPTKAEFDSQLDQATVSGETTQKHISEEDYALAQLVWLKAGCVTFYDYLSLYLKTDVVLLADVFEAFRSVCLKYYGLDPCHYFTAPGFSWDAMLKMTGVEIECFKEGQIDMLQMVQQGMRGGISMISTRYAKANNKYLSNHDPSKPSSYLTYLDANNLYGWAMSQFLPIGGYKWEENVARFTPEIISRMSDTAPRGFIFEADLSIPVHLHDYFNDYPVAPESTLFDPSPIMKDLKEKLEMGDCKVDKLIPNLNNKTKYVLHYRNLKLYLQLGLKLDKIHRVLSFDQSPYLKKYIDFNTSKRAQSKNDFEKDFFKLLNNAIFGKTCENVDKRIEVQLITNPEKFTKMASRPYFKNFEIFTNDLIACEMKKTKIVYNRPMIVGMCILDLSKVLMYDFHYNTMKKRYGDKATLCFTDTDSLTYHIQTEDFYNDMKDNIEMYDTSDYPSDHPCYSNVNKKVIGKFKDELNGVPMMEFVGLRAKMYSILKDETHNKATAKGIKRSVIKSLTHEQYKLAIFGTTKEELQQKVSFNLIRSENHQLNSIKVTKTGLCAYDDKRWVLDDNVHTLAHGHYRTQSE